MDRHKAHEAFPPSSDRATAAGNGSCRATGPQRERTRVSFSAGGILVNTPEDPGVSKITTEEEIEFYIQQFKKSGFRSKEGNPRQGGRLVSCWRVEVVLHHSPCEHPSDLSD